VTDPVAQIRRILVGGVFHRPDAKLRAQSAGLGSTNPEDWVSRSETHRREAVGGGAAEEVEQDGFCLIVGSVTRRGSHRQDAEPRCPGPSLEVGSRYDVHAVNDDLGPYGHRHFVHDLHVLGGILPQPMVDVVSDHVASRGDGEKHQGERVGTA